MMDDKTLKDLLKDAMGDQQKSLGREVSNAVAGFYKGLRDSGVPTQAAIPVTVTFVSEFFQHMRWLFEREDRKR